MSSITLWLIMIAVLILQFIVSRMPAGFLGGILPVGYSVFIVSLFIKTDSGLNFSFFATLIGGLAILLGIWNNGRVSVNDKRRKELDKIRLHDM